MTKLERIEYNRVYGSIYRKKHRKELSRKQKLYRQNHGEEVRARDRAYYYKDQEKNIEYNKAYYKKNKEKVSLSQKANYEKHREEKIEYQKKYYRRDIIKSRKVHSLRNKKHREKFPEKHAIYALRRRVAKLGAEGSHTWEEWLTVKSLCKGICACCHKRRKLVRDHIIPLNWGGTDYIWNIQPLCVSCNSIKSDSHATNYMEIN